MLSFAHTIISLPLGIHINNPIIIFLSAFVLHLFCDTFLHWNIYPAYFKKYPIFLVILDMTIGLFIAYLITGTAILTLPILTAIIGGNAPDAIQQIWELSPRNLKKMVSIANPFFKFHDKIQYETLNESKGLISQFSLVVFAIILSLL